MAVPVTGGGATGGAGGTTQRHTVEVATTITANTTQATESVKRLTTQTEGLEKSIARAQAAFSGKGPVGLSPAAGQWLGGLKAVEADAQKWRQGIWGPFANGFGPGMSLIGSRLGSMAGSSFAGYATVAGAVSGVSNLATALNDFDNAAVSTHDKMKKLAGVIPLVGERMYELFTMFNERMALSGASGGWGGEYAALRESVQQHPFRLANRLNELDGKYARSATEMEYRRAAIRADAYRTSTSPYDVNRYAEIDAEVMPDKRSALQARMDAERGIASAERELRVARLDKTMTVSTAEAELEAARKRHADAQDGLRKSYKSLGESEQLGAGGPNVGGGTPAEMALGFGAFLSNPMAIYQSYAGENVKQKAEFTRDQLAAEKKVAEAAREVAEAEKRILEAKEKQRVVVEKEVELQRAKANLLKAQLADIERQYQKAESGAASYLLRPPNEQRALTMAARTMKERGGYEYLTEEERNLLASDSQGAELLQEQTLRDARNRATGGGKRVAEYQAALGQQDLQTLDAERKRLRVEHDVTLKLADQANADQVKKFLEQWLPSVFEIIGFKTRQSDAQRDLQQQQRHAMFRAGTGGN